MPSDEECRHIRQLIAAPMQQLQALSAEMACAPAHLDQLNRKQWDELNEFVDSHLALLTSARKLPDDIMREIFNLLLPGPNGRSTIAVGHIDSPLQISHVCRDWRGVTLSMPHLWNGLDIVVDTAPKDAATYLKKLDEALKAWLSRSGELPLTISIVWTSREFGSCSILIETLKAVSARWQHIRFSIPSYDFFFSPLRLLRTRNVPILQSVVLDIRDADTTLPSYPSRLGFLPFLEASNIRYVSIKTYPTNFYRYPLNWEELRNLSLGPRVRGQQPHTVSFLETHHILRRCVQLRTLIIPLYDSDVGGVPPTAPLRLENLQRLCVIDSLNNTVFFKRVDLPNLRHLEYKSISVRLMFMSSLRAPEQITSLSLSTPLSQSSLQECLRYLPRLQNLTINWFQAIGGRLQILPLLTPRPDDPHPMLCPDLQHFCCLRMEDGSDQELLEMIVARADANAALSNVDIAFGSREREVDIVPQLQPLIDEGLRVSLRYPTAANIKLGFDQLLWSYDERRWVDPGMSEWHPISEDWKADYARWGLPSQNSPQEE